MNNDDRGTQTGNESGEEPNDEMSDVKFDSWLQSAARDYNRPGDVPRDAMWAAIESAVPSAPSAPSAPSVSSAASAPVIPLARGGATRRYWQAAAAVAILAAGIGIGRLWTPRAAAPGQALEVAATPDAAPESMLASGDTTTRRDVRGERAAAAPSLRNDEAGNDSYDIAAVQHMSRAEALLTSFRTSGSGETQASMNVWARDLLADTRLLLDSPAATDARRRHLLEDLELVLAQIVQLPAESSADRSVVQRSIERGAMLSRLRSTIPAGFSSGT